MLIHATSCYNAILEIMPFSYTTTFTQVDPGI